MLNLTLHCFVAIKLPISDNHLKLNFLARGSVGRRNCSTKSAEINSSQEPLSIVKGISLCWYNNGLKINCLVVQPDHQNIVCATQLNSVVGVVSSVTAAITREGNNIGNEESHGVGQSDQCMFPRKICIVIRRVKRPWEVEKEISVEPLLVEVVGGEDDGWWRQQEILSCGGALVAAKYAQAWWSHQWPCSFCL